MKKKAIITAIVTVILAVAGAFFGITYTEKDVEKISDGIEAVVDIVDNKSTTEIPEQTKEDEETLEYQETEKEGFELQGEIAYNGVSEIPKLTTGQYAGLTYYSQIDSRWKNQLYTSVGNNTQTIGSSGCGPTSSAMVVSSIRGTVLPPEMADLYVKYGFRSANNGTYWSAFRWTADAYNIGYTETIYLNTLCDLLEQNYMAITGCGNGLFTTGGHFIVVYGWEDKDGDGQCEDGERLKVYDPYLYNGKFDLSSRRGKAQVVGNTVYVSKANFRAYANYGTFFCFKNDRTDKKENTTPVNIVPATPSTSSVNYKVKVTAKSGLNARSGASTSYPKKGGYGYGRQLTIIAESNGWGKTTDGLWVCLQYTSKITNTATVKNTVGQYKKFKRTYTYIYSKSNLSGYKYTYLANTKVKILQNVSSNVDRIYVPATGRYGYVNTNVYK